MKIEVARLVKVFIEVPDGTLDRIVEVHNPYCNLLGDACFFVDGPEIGLEPGEYLVWGV